MPRKGFVSRRTVQSDAVYASDLVQKFINYMMWDGKRSTAQRIFYGAMEQVGQKANDEPLKIFKKAAAPPCAFPFSLKSGANNGFKETLLQSQL